MLSSPTPACSVSGEHDAAKLMAAQTRILLVMQGHQDCERLTLSLTGDGYVVRSSESPVGLQALVQEYSPDLLLLERPWPGRASLNLLHALRTDIQTRHLPVLVLLGIDSTRAKVEALDAGADDCLSKSCDLEELHGRIRALMRRRGQYQHPEVLYIHGLRIDPLAQVVTAQTENGRRSVRLKPLAFRLLHFLVTHPEQFHIRSQLLARVWGSHVGVLPRTVDVHVRGLRLALAGTSCEDCIRTMRGRGYGWFTPVVPSP